MNITASIALSLFALPIALAASMQTSDADLSKLTGQIKVDGSSTVYPITEAVAEDFQGKATKTRTTVGVSGTGGGFKDSAPARPTSPMPAVQSAHRKRRPPRQTKLTLLNFQLRLTD